MLLDMSPNKVQLDYCRDIQMHSFEANLEAGLYL